MILVDAYVIEFIGGNWLTMGLILMMLKGLAQISPWKWDEKIVALLTGMFHSVKKKD